MEGSKEITIDELFNLTMDRKWDEIVKVYGKYSWAHTTKLTKSEETALHVAVSSYHSEGVSCNECSIKGMIDCFSEKTKEILSMRNDKGDTPLHLAAAVGWVNICESIASKDRHLIEVHNSRNETPLFVAAYHGNLEAFVRLHKIYNVEIDREPDYSLCRRKDGNTILHFAISGEHFDLAYRIISYYPKLVDWVNEEGESPLHVLAKKPNVFKSTSHMRLYDSIIYHCVSVDELKKNNHETKQSNDYGHKCCINYPDNYSTCINIVQLLYKNVTACLGFDGRARARDEENQNQACLGFCACAPASDEACLGFGRRPSACACACACACTCDCDEENQHLDGGEESKNIRPFPANYATCILLFKFAMTVILTVLGVGFNRIKKIREKKQRHVHAIQIMNQMMASETSYKHNKDGQKPVLTLESEYEGRIPFPDIPPADVNVHKEPNTLTTSRGEAQSKDNKKEKGQDKSDKQDTPILIAAKMGILEMVDKILCKCPIAIQDLDSEGKNVLMVAAENRQTSVFDYLLKKKLPEYIFHQVDDEGNSILHLAAMLGDQQPWRIPGAALQMQWEVKWYEHVKKSIPSPFFAYNNKKGETPRKIFAVKHKDLIEQGTEWLKKTSESCSVIAALIASVAFATSATVPGGLNGLTGHPILENNTTFEIFSISSLVALCLSVTALVYFLAILTSRGQEYDFKRNLPRKLLKGLTALFASIAAMLVSFCAGHTFVLMKDLRLFNVSIYAIACIPVTLFAIAQLPLYFDLLKANYKKVPLRCYKVFHQ